MWFITRGGKYANAYIENATDMPGITRKASRYDLVKVKDKGYKNQEESSAHIRKALGRGNKWHVRPLLVVDEGHVSFHKKKTKGGIQQ